MSVLEWFTVGYQIDRCVGFIHKAIARLDKLRAIAQDEIEMHHLNIDQLESRIGVQEECIQTLQLDQTRINRLKEKLEGLVA